MRAHTRPAGTRAAITLNARRASAKGGGAGLADRLLNLALGGVAFVMPLACWPGAVHPFSTPKFIVLIAALLPAAALGIAAGRFRVPALPRMVAGSALLLVAAVGAAAWQGLLVSPSALALQVAAVGWFLLLVALRPAASVVADALVASATVVAAVAILQWAGLDPFGLFGYVADASGRMRVYGTLGNPNFLAVFLVAILPLTVARGYTVPARRRYVVPAAALQVAALAGTGSRGAALALVAIALFLVIALRGRRRLIAASSLAVAAAIVVLSGGRPVAETVAGRLYIWKVAAPHVLDRPIVGFGPGAFEPMYVSWQTQAWQSAAFPESARRFAAVQDHAHNDFLEFAVDAGLPAPLGLGAFVLSLLLYARRRTHAAVALAAACGVAGIGAAALVDFPLHRPAELFVFWILAATVLLDRNAGATASE